MRVHPLVAGRAGGEALALDEPLSMWGGLDPETGEIIDVHHPQRGTFVTGRVLVMASGRGSSSASSVIAEAIRARTGPAAIVLSHPDGILTVGALVAEALYSLTCPIVVAAPDAYAAARAARSVIVDGSRLATVEIEVASAAEVLPLRAAILRAGMPSETARFEGDDDGEARHVVARLDGVVIGVASMLRQSIPGEHSPAWRIRGMAVDPDWRNCGIGSALLRDLLDSADSVVWCNARPAAVSLYERHGFAVAGDEFETEVGPHLRMVRPG